MGVCGPISTGSGRDAALVKQELEAPVTRVIYVGVVEVGVAEKRLHATSAARVPRSAICRRTIALHRTSDGQSGSHAP